MTSYVSRIGPYYELATNQAVGSSNLSGRAKTQRVPIGGPFSFGVSWMKMRTAVRQNAQAFWTHEVRPEGVRIDLREIRSEAGLAGRHN